MTKNAHLPKNQHPSAIFFGGKILALMTPYKTHLILLQFLSGKKGLYGVISMVPVSQNPYPILDLLYLELYHYKCFQWKPSVNRGCQWGIALVSKQLKKSQLVGKLLKKVASISKQQKRRLNSKFV